MDNVNVFSRRGFLQGVVAAGAVTVFDDVGDARCVIDQPCHVVLDVPPGGETYAFSCFSAIQAGNPLKGEFTFITG